MLVYERKHFPENAKIKCYGCHLYNPFLYIHDYSKKSVIHVTYFWYEKLNEKGALLLFL